MMSLHFQSILIFLFTTLSFAFPLETLVQLKNLSKEEFNGRIGIIFMLPIEEGGRYGVMVHDPLNDEKLFEKFSFKKENLFLPTYPEDVRRPEEELDTAVHKFSNAIIFHFPDLYEHSIEITLQDKIFIAKKMEMLFRLARGNPFLINENPIIRRVTRAIGSSLYMRFGFYGCVEACNFSHEFSSALEEAWDGIGNFRY